MTCDNDAIVAHSGDLGWLSAELDSAAWLSSQHVAEAPAAAPHASDTVWPFVIIGVLAGIAHWFLA